MPSSDSIRAQLEEMTVWCNDKGAAILDGESVWSGSQWFFQVADLLNYAVKEIDRERAAREAAERHIYKLREACGEWEASIDDLLVRVERDYKARRQCGCYPWDGIHATDCAFSRLRAVEAALREIIENVGRCTLYGAADAARESLRKGEAALSGVTETTTKE